MTQLSDITLQNTSSTSAVQEKLNITFNKENDPAPGVKCIYEGFKAVAGNKSSVPSWSRL